MKYFSIFFLLAASQSYAQDLGELIELKRNQDNSINFGVVYTHSDDPDGSNYLLSFVPKNIRSEPFDYVWNFYDHIGKKFLLSWDETRVASSVVTQVIVKDRSIIGKLLELQKPVKQSNSLSFVLLKSNKQPQYYLPISELCDENPELFADLSYGLKCNQFN
jgi:hypothetical protein